MGSSGISIMALDAYIGQTNQVIDLSKSCCLSSSSSTPVLMLIVGQSGKLVLASRNRGLWWKCSAKSIISGLPVPLHVKARVAGQFTC